MGKIKVLRIINRFNLGGPTYNAAYLTKYLPDEFETLLVGGEKYEEEESSTFIVEQLGLNPVVIPEMQREINRKNDRIAYQKLKEIIRDFKPDIVHTHASKAGTLGRLAARKMNVPIIIHTFHGHVFHSYFGKAKTTFYKNIERYLAKRSTKIITISELQQHELTQVHRICPLEKTVVIPLGFDLARFQENIAEKRRSFRKQFLLNDDEVAIGIIGRLVPIKNHGMFLNAMQRLMKQTTKKVRVFVVGDGEEKVNLFKHAKSLELGICDWTKEQTKATITFTSWLKDIDRVNAGLDVIALSSLNEGTPVSLIEAQASNKPIVTTNVGGVKNVTIENKTAFITEVNDIDHFSESLLKLVEDKELRLQMGEQGWDFVRERFSYQRLASDVADLYKGLLNGK